jgi:hypothetical protein
MDDTPKTVLQRYAELVNEVNCLRFDTSDEAEAVQRAWIERYALERTVTCATARIGRKWTVFLEG